MKINFIDIQRERFLPFAFTRPLACLRAGIVTLEERWLHFIPGDSGYVTEDYLSGKFPAFDDANYTINALVIPNQELINEINDLSDNTGLKKGDLKIAAKGDFDNVEWLESKLEIDSLNAVWDIFHKNGELIRQDFEWLTKNKSSQPVADHTVVIGDRANLFVEKGATVNAMVLNVSDGPIYIGKDAEVMEGSVIKGSFALLDHGVVKMSAKIYGDTTFGPYCKVGGEVSNTVMFGYSNKGHDGFVGNSVIGEWCNLGADTNSSNLKNNYSPVKVWSYSTESLETTGLQFCGLIMGDHAKTGINTMLNTGTTVGVCANVFGGGFPDKFIPSFAWGGADGFVSFKMEKAIEVAERMMARRKVNFTKEDKTIFQAIYEQTTKFRVS